MLKKLSFKAGVNRENTRYTTEGGYYDCDKIRFRQGTPEVIGGWAPTTTSTFAGVCRSLWNWVTLSGYNLIGVGTNLKFYIARGGAYIDITPIRRVVTLTNPFTASVGSNTITVSDTAHGCITGDYVTYYGASSLGGQITAAVLNQQHQITYVDASTYKITVSEIATIADTGHGGTVQSLYQINVGSEYQTATTGWGCGYWGYGPWSIGVPTTNLMRLWSQANFGQDLVFGPRNGAIYYWPAAFETGNDIVTITIASPAVVTASGTFYEGTPISFESTGALPTGLAIGTIYYVRNPSGSTFNVSATVSGSLINTSGTQSGTQSISPRAVLLSSLATASDVPTIQNYVFVSDTYRFVFAFGCNDLASTTQDPMLVRWSDQEDAGMWTPSATNQAGSLRLSHGSEIITAVQTRQEIVVFTDSSLYSIQYLGPPYVWGSQLLGDNISIVGENAVTIASGVVYWMGKDKFYKYDGRIQTLRCDLRQYVFADINASQYQQVYAGTNEGFNEVWWFYCSADSLENDRYVVYNYVEDIWYYGTIGRTAWLDSGTLTNPIGATYSSTLVNHEYGLNDNEAGADSAIHAYITTSEADIDDGHNFVFVRRILPDVTFRGSTAESPTATMSIIPLNNSGSGYTNPPSVGGTDNAAITRTATVPIEQFTGQVFIRVRGRQFAFKIESNQLDTTWQLGSPRLEIQLDGRRST